jgi:hypothetical protein
MSSARELRADIFESDESDAGRGIGTGREGIGRAMIEMSFHSRRNEGNESSMPGGHPWLITWRN